MQRSTGLSISVEKTSASQSTVSKLYLKTKPERFFFHCCLFRFEEKVQSVRLRRFHSKVNTHTVYSVRLYKPTFTTISLKKKSLMWNFMLCKTNEYITGCFQLLFDSFEVSVNISSMNNKFAASKSEICVIHRQRSLKKKCLSYVFFCCCCCCHWCLLVLYNIWLWWKGIIIIIITIYHTFVDVHLYLVTTICQ